MKIPLTPPSIRDLFSEVRPERFTELMSAGIGKIPEDEYLHWDELRHKPVPDEKFSSKEWWFATKMSRSITAVMLPFHDRTGRRMTYSQPPIVQRMLHRVDRDASGRIEVPEAVANPHTRGRFLVRSLIEEAITSSQLEGASTTRKVAKEMLRQGRKPRNRSEQMIFNNYRAMEFIRINFGVPLNEDLIKELHTILVRDTLDDPSAIGRWRRKDEFISVVDHRDETTLHIPPDADELPDRIKLLIEFANQDEEHQFIHPVLRAILVHFMIGYDHPFVDGNGRTARALFYWSMARDGYWMMEFTSISTILRNAPAQYARSFLRTETDDNDTTYFIIYQLEVILRAIESLHVYLAKKMHEVREADTWLKGSSALRSKLNHRQIALIQHALKHQYQTYTIRSHMISHNVTYETARSDLLRLADEGLLIKTMRDRAYTFLVPENLRELLSDLRRAS